MPSTEISCQCHVRSILFWNMPAPILVIVNHILLSLSLRLRFQEEFVATEIPLPVTTWLPCRSIPILIRVFPAVFQFWFIAHTYSRYPCRRQLIQVDPYFTSSTWTSRCFSNIQSCCISIFPVRYFPISECLFRVSIPSSGMRTFAGIWPPSTSRLATSWRRPKWSTASSFPLSTLPCPKFGSSPRSSSWPPSPSFYSPEVIAAPSPPPLITFWHRSLQRSPDTALLTRPFRWMQAPFSQSLSPRSSVSSNVICFYLEHHSECLINTSPLPGPFNFN